MRYFCAFIRAVFLLVCFNAYAQLPANYQSLSAQEKQDLLWGEISKSHEEEPLPPFTGNSFNEVLAKLKGLFNLGPSFDHISDELPAGLGQNYSC